MNDATEQQKDHILQDLLTPSLQGYDHHSGDRRNKPWRLTSQLWAAFLGGVLSYTVIAYVNGKNLRMSRSRQFATLLVGVMGFITMIPLSYFLAMAKLPAGWAGNSEIVTIFNRAWALSVYTIIYQIQKPADRIYHFMNEGEYASFWVPGLAAIIGLGLLQNAIVSWFFDVFSRFL